MERVAREKDQWTDTTTSKLVTAESLSTVVSMVAYLSKGFPMKARASDEEVKAIFKTMLASVIRTFDAFPSHPTIRQKTIFFVHRTILLLNGDILQFLPTIFSILISKASDSNDLNSITQLINMVCIKFKARTVPVLSPALLPFLSKCVECLPNGEGTAKQETVERTG